jgi:homoserine kinase
VSAPPHVAVEVPASSANLGPGFDALAAALDVTLSVTTVDRTDQRILAQGLGAEELPTDDSNLIWRALVAYCERFDVDVPDVSLRADNAIPLERGMGSSAAAAVAGAVIGRAMVERGSDAELIAIATGLEGHPDNAAAALLGGVVVCAEGIARRLEPAGTLRPVICIPDARQSTQAARGVLPDSIGLADAAANGARTAMLLAGLSGALAWEPTAMRDVLHEPARFTVMTESGRLVTALRDQGVAACLSGAGPSVLAIVECSDADAVDRIRRAAGGGWDVRAVAWHRGGASKVAPTAAGAAQPRTERDEAAAENG